MNIAKECKCKEDGASKNPVSIPCPPALSASLVRHANLLLLQSLELRSFGRCAGPAFEYFLVYGVRQWILPVGVVRLSQLADTNNGPRMLCVRSRDKVRSLRMASFVPSEVVRCPEFHVRLWANRLFSCSSPFSFSLQLLERVY